MDIRNLSSLRDPALIAEDIADINYGMALFCMFLSATLAMFSISIASISTASESLKNFLVLMTAYLTLYQTAIFLSSHIPRRLIGVLAIVPLLAMLLAHTGPRVGIGGNKLANGFQDLFAGSAHPVAVLASKAKVNAKLLASKQSKTLSEAVTEYRQRYKHSPPPGFDKWFALAIQKNFTLIDEFDDMMKSLKPF